MDTIKCRLTTVKETFNQGYIAEVKLVEGSVPEGIIFSNKVQCNETSFLLPISLVEIDQENEKYHLYLNTSAYQKQNYSNLLEKLQNEDFELEALEDSAFTLQSNYKSMLLLIDNPAMLDSLAVVDLLHSHNIDMKVCVRTEREQENDVINHLKQKLNNNEVSLLSSFDDDRINSIIKEQTIGTNLFISGSWTRINDLRQIAYNVGLTDEEIHFKRIGPKVEKVRCAKCYSVTTNQSEEDIEEITCEHCDTVLEVGPNYSKIHGAFQGYIIIDNVG